MRCMLRGKIHRATVTQADLDYIGSLTVDTDLLEAADILPYEQVAVFNITNGSRLETYTIAGPRGSGAICANGAAAHLVREGDLVIIAAYQWVPDEEAPQVAPKLVFVNDRNRIVEVRSEIAPFERAPVS